MSSYGKATQSIANKFKNPKGVVLSQYDDDVVVVSSVRSAITKAKKGGFKDTRPEEILSGVLSAVYKQVNLNPALIEDISVGNVLAAGGGASAARMAALHAGIPNTTPINTINRQCSSGLTAINQIAAQIAIGQIDIGIGTCISNFHLCSIFTCEIGAGVESMTFGYGAGAQPDGFSDAVLSCQEAEDCLIPMGITSENVASDFGVTRQVQDEFAAKSFQKAADAQKAGKFPEIVPITVTWVDPKTEKEMRVTIDKDDGVRAGVTAESLAKLKPAFDKNGTTHAGNASQVSDGAAATLLARRSVAVKLGLPILGKFVGAAVVGVPPRIMGVGPAYAIPAVLAKHGLTVEDVDFFEVRRVSVSVISFCSTTFS